MAKYASADIPCMNLTAAASSVFHFKVEGYSIIKEASKSFTNFYESGKFSVGGHEWTVRFFPNSAPSRFSVALHLLNPPKEAVAVSFACTVLCKSGEPSEELEVARTENIPGCGVMFQPREALVSMKHESVAEFVALDCLLLQCTISVLKHPERLPLF